MTLSASRRQNQSRLVFTDHGMSLGPSQVTGDISCSWVNLMGYLIMNGLTCFPGSGDFTCFPHIGGANVADYILATYDLLPHIQHLSISRVPLANYALITFLLSTPPLPATSTISQIISLPLPPYPPSFSIGILPLSMLPVSSNCYLPFPTLEPWIVPQPNTSYSPRPSRKLPRTPIPTRLTRTSVSPLLAPVP